VEIGLTDKADSAKWILEELWRRGVGPRLVLVAGDELGPLGGVPGSDSRLLSPSPAKRATAVSVGVEPEGVPAGVLQIAGGPDAFADILDDQIARRRRRAVPELDGDRSWTLAIDGVDTTLERAHESLLTLADGRIGTTGSPLGTHPAAAPSVLAGDVYVGSGADSELISCPTWNRLPFGLSGERLSRRLDLHTGVLRYELDGGLEAVAFSCLGRPGTTVLRAAGRRELLDGAEVLVPPESGHWRSDRGTGRTSMTCSATRGGVAVAGSQSLQADRSTATLDRLAVYRTNGAVAPSKDEALARLQTAEGDGFEALLAEHRQTWGQRWERADVRIEGDPELQLAVRLALMQMMATVADEDEAAVGARGLSGSAYRGHVFWDACVFVLPFLAATHPPAARAMLEYRIRRLPAALTAARELGKRGARLPWESAADGTDVTPSSAFTRAGEHFPVLTGQLAEHIVADVAWAVAHYVDWTGDAEFLHGPGGRVLAETARYWASRVELDRAGFAHVRNVMGPDEYHGPVDDNAYTNVMARWNLRRAASLDGGSAAEVTDAERAQWLSIAGSLVDGCDPTTRVYEQFAGFRELEPLVIADVAPQRPIAADLLLGHPRVASAQVVKQADVLMLHHLVPHEVAPGSLAPNLDFYEPRTAHGSTLSPGIHAALLARTGRLEEACEALRLTARIDLDDISETTAGGLHLAAMGSVWQALAYGFAGLRPAGDALRVDPRLPGDWNELELRVTFRGTAVRVRIDAEQVHAWAEWSVPLQLADGSPTEVGPQGVSLRRDIR
jgi:trehalose/maltose hydrolase-like predicted phosphorylase